MAKGHLNNVFLSWPDEKKEKVVKVQVMAQQWAWSFRYAGADGEFDTADDIITLNDLRVPVGRKVLIQLTAKNVVHAFYIPNIKLKMDAIPGKVTRMWFDLNRPGVYDIACSKVCGIHHYLMRAKLTVYSEDNYNHWMQKAQKVALVTNDPDGASVFRGWKWNIGNAYTKAGLREKNDKRSDTIPQAGKTRI